jgi:hypothetical protein
MRGRDLVGATGGWEDRSLYRQRTPPTFACFSDFSNRGGKLRAVLEEYPHYGGCRISTHDSEQARDDPPGMWSR